MLDQETKRKIDSARNILVGKVPDPKQQVDQITNALIYKFMDDMDKENEEVGLKAQFFIDDWKKFSWTELLNNKLSGQERLDLYTQAIANMSKNPHIPQLFRDIFKGAFLPYNDPRTLSLFLKEINEFSYDHSEDLGDAFEYLLSVLGSQGDAGQFRTPRHIIDFIVEVVDPRKNETVLDPACGTGGFLIAAYKHILETNKKKPLTPDEKLKLMNNLAGYDISPDMVKLALVNMYLHGSPNPKIYEYDTLSSENRWDETFDVILANPPFMTPKGGIRPHKRFSIQANRAEVLFVDYIINHLNLKGRAGIIVPEGIIFQTANAYKALRKKLVEDGLVAVISLPSGVFNRYSGVKTSILLFDNEIAKRADNLLFVKITNDGFDLGAQRREIDKNDLPTALEIIKKYRETQSDENFTEAEKEMAQVVAKEKIAESGDYNLTGERYREVETFTNQKWPMVELGEVCEIYQPKTVTSKEINKEYKKGWYKVFGANGAIGYYHSYNEEYPEVLVTCRGATCGTVNLSEHKCWVTGNAMVVRPKNSNILLKKFLFYFLKNKNLSSVVSGSAQPQIIRSSLSLFKISLPPLSVQKEIVEKIEVKQKAIDAAKEVIRNLERERAYFGESLRRIEGIEWVELGEVCEFVRGPFGGSLKKEIFVTEGFAVFEQQHAIYGNFTNFRYFITPDKFEEMKRFEVKPNDLIMSCSGTIGKTVIIPKNAPRGIINQALLKLKVTEKLDVRYLKYWMDGKYFQKSVFENVEGVAIKNVASVKVLSSIKIPLPSLEIQQKMIAETEEEQKIIDANKRLIEIMEGKIEKVLEEI
ncbi:MAG TPA: N-6 DNA methylase [Candidatus Magasanikbacteria bacterium]|nr:N-6 DNA methylase [Candidatus Magasanikbacteria bacterium]